jgi:hypothetical protein
MSSLILNNDNLNLKRRYSPMELQECSLTIKQFDSLLEAHETNRLELGRLALELKQAHLSKGKRIAGMGWLAFCEKRNLKCDTVDKWILAYERSVGLKPPSEPDPFDSPFDFEAFEASLTNKERRELGMPYEKPQKTDRAADCDNRLPDLMEFVQRYYFKHYKNDAKFALQLWQEDVEIITDRMTELASSKRRGKKEPFVKRDRKPPSAEAIYKRNMNLERAQEALYNRDYTEDRCPASSSESIPF